jgi:hypothetical protein
MVTAKERNKFAQKEIDFKMRYQVFPQGWNKTYCLRYLDEFCEIHFFGDKTYKGGNDFEIYESKRTLGHTELDNCKRKNLNNPKDMIGDILFPCS